MQTIGMELPWMKVGCLSNIALCTSSLGRDCQRSWRESLLTHRKTGKTNRGSAGQDQGPGSIRGGAEHGEDGGRIQGGSRGW